MALFLSSNNTLLKRDQLEELHGMEGGWGVWQLLTIHHNLANITGGINQRWAKLQKEMSINSFGSIFVSLVQKAANDFF